MGLRKFVERRCCISIRAPTQTSQQALQLTQENRLLLETPETTLPVLLGGSHGRPCARQSGARIFRGTPP